MPRDQMSSRRRIVGTGDVRLAVVERGAAGRPPIVLMHGYPDTCSVWDEVADILCGRYHVITYDMRGAGASTAPSGTENYRLARLAADLRAVIAEVSPDRPVHLVGHDWGSIQAWDAVTRPGLTGRIASLTSVGGPSLDQVAGWLRHRARSGPRGLADVANQLARSWYIGFFKLPVVPELVWRVGLGRMWGRLLAAREGVRPRPGHPAGTITGDAVHGLALYRANIGGRAGQRRPHGRPASIDVPVQIVVATRDRFVSPRTQLAVTGHVPLLRRKQIRAGHWVQRTHPVELAGLISEFVDHVAADQAKTGGSPA